MREPGRLLRPRSGWYRALGLGVAGALPRMLDPRGRVRRRLRPDRPSWTGPTTYVWGRRDVALGRAAAERTGRFVRGDYRFVELDAGHWLPETRPAEVAAEILERAVGRVAR